jgi:hypothetical protein
MLLMRVLLLLSLIDHMLASAAASISATALRVLIV